MTGRPLIVFIGAPGAGKTRLGKRVARLLATPFIDTDRVITRQYGPIPDIFGAHGEAEFRRIERAAVVEALGEDAVVSLGGGAILDPHTQVDLASHRVALVTVSAAAVAARIGGSKRPLSRDLDAWSALVASRRDIYERLATATWDTSSRPIDHIAAEIADWISNRDTTESASNEAAP